MPCHKKPVDTGIYTAKEKMKDNVYLDQFEKLKDCKKNFKSSEQDLENILTKRWSDDAYNELKKTFKDLNENYFERQNFIDCIKIVAEKNAEVFVCNRCKEFPLKFDLVIHYAKIEFEICVEQKNKANRLPLFFLRPKIGPENEV
ncbi:hypothetical protein GVAV_000606 [Gurleya vavrai]